MSGHLFSCSRKHSWPPDEYVSSDSLHLLDVDGGAPPKHAWRRRLNSHADLLTEFRVTFMEAIRMMRLGLRLWRYVRKEASQGRRAPIDPFTRERHKPSASLGVPLGGMGSGNISRGFRGEFKQWHIFPGSCELSPVMANQFSFFVSRDGGKKIYSSVLAPGQHEGLKKSGDKGLSSWDWDLSGQHSTYHALFPRAWTIYDGEPDPELKNSCRQISPFIPHDYRESSLPSCVFVYTLVNTGRERAKVSLLMTWANSIGGVSHQYGDHVNEPFIGDGVSGVLLHHKTAKDNPPVTFAIAACETQNDGHFGRDNFNTGPCTPSSPGAMLCAAVSASTWVEPHGKCVIAFALAWSSPNVKFQKGCNYYRRYTKFYGTSERSAVRLAHDALMNYKWWEEEIEKWQSPILNDEKLPEWYKFTLFNEIYFLVAGGTVWTDGGYPAVEDKADNRTGKHKFKKLKIKKARATTRKDGAMAPVVNHIAADDQMQNQDAEEIAAGSILGHELADNANQSGHDSVRTGPLGSSLDDAEDVGRFLYLEGIEYVMWCTYDVHFYASFALLDLFPRIEMSIQRDFARAIMSEDREKVRFLADGSWGIRKVKGAVPHDLGMHDPWHEMNAYNIHDTSRWKDLNPKFVLQVYRDFAATADMSFARDVWPAVFAAMEYMEQFDRDGDGLIENDGFPDQTYDTWTVHGISAYCGCLWLASLQAAAAMARHLGDHAFADKCETRFLKARPVLESKLWNGSYFNYDSGTSNSSRSIQADMLAGQWYAASSGLPSLFDATKVRSSLQKIFDFNVMKVRGGRMGAVNGMTHKGKVDESCMQSREIWTGVTYAVSSTMLLAGMEQQAFATAEGIFTTGWSEEGFGYWFQTPEAWTVDGHYRSLVYMRPLAIWAMQWALSSPKTVLDAPKIYTDIRSVSLPKERIPNERASRRVAFKSKGCGRNVFVLC